MSLNGKVDVMVAALPRILVSLAGAKPMTLENMLFEKYVNVVQHLEAQDHCARECTWHAGRAPCAEGGVPKQSYYEQLVNQLGEIGYQVSGGTIDASRFGVPQKRSRLIVIGVRKDITTDRLNGGVTRVFEHIEQSRLKQLSLFGLTSRFLLQMLFPIF